jgi:predicted metal-dependent phosphoesterase TrpH
MIDLHTHSTASDGTCSPTELATRAAAAGLSAVALTDHETTAGLAEFCAAATALGVQPVHGIEIACAWYQGSVHLLGLFIATDTPALTAILAETRTQRDRRNVAILARLRAAGCAIDAADLAATAAGGTPGRPHLARALVEHGYCESINDAFDRYLADRHLRGIRLWRPLPKDVIAAIHEAGGVASWAHPIGPVSWQRGRLRKVARQLRAAGLDAMEAYYSSFSREQHEAALAVAADLGLAVSGGSDFHGENSPGVEIGCGRGNLAVPDDVLTQLSKCRPASAAASA